MDHPWNGGYERSYFRNVWASAANLAELASITETEVRETLSKNFATFNSGKYDVIVRLKSQDEAQKLVSLIRDFQRKGEQAPAVQAAAE